MNILALDTATEVSSVAVFNGSETFSVESDSKTQSRSLLQTVEQQLEAADLRLRDLDLIVFDKGPGSFTGMRIATGVAQGLSYGLNVRVVGVSSLEAMAYATDAEYVAAAIDARMGEIYFGCYQRQSTGSMRALCDEQVIRPELAVLPSEQTQEVWATAGTGWSVYERKLREVNDSASFVLSSIVHPAAKHLIEIALLRPDEDAENLLALPSYIRNNVAKKAGEK